MFLDDIIKYVRVKKGVIHLGANIAQEAEWYMRKKFKRVLWFEPCNEIYPKLLENIERFGERQKAFKVGVHDTLKEATLNVTNFGGESSSILEFGLHSEYSPHLRFIKKYTIPLIRMDDFFNNNGENINDYNFLNVDVQGVELNAIKSFGEFIKKINYIVTEVNTAELYKNCSLLPDVDGYLSSYGFKRIITKMTPYNWGEAFYKK